MKLLLSLIFVLSSSSVFAQTLIGERIRLTTGPCIIRSGSGTPEGSVTGNVCDIYINTANAQIYEKWTGTGNTGWSVGFRVAASIEALMKTPSYVSQLTGWQIDVAGAADFRYLFTDELHAKSFIADLEQALAGGQIICKSVTMLGANYTVPAAGGTTTITVRDLPSAENVAVFQSGDWIGLRTFTRTAGALTIAEAFGTATSYADQAGGVQTWSFTRGSGGDAGGMAASTVVQADAIVIDYGVSGNGCHEVNAIDGANGINSPYSQTWTWTTSPIPANRSVKTRVGNVRGITAIDGEYGLFAGSYGATQWVRATNVAVELAGVNFSMYSGATEVFKIDRTAPSLALGNPLPSAYGTGTGIWMGDIGGDVYSFRVGVPGGAGMFWDGSTSTLTVRGTAGSGRNMLPNTDCRVSTEGWSIAGGSSTGLTENISFGSDPLDLGNEGGTCYTQTIGTPAVDTVSQAYNTPSIPVTAGLYYEASMYVGGNGSDGTAHVFIGFLNEAQTVYTGFANVISPYSFSSGTCPGGYRLNQFCRIGTVGQAPSGSVWARIFVQRTHGGGTLNPYTLFVRTYFGEATSTQTLLTEWGPAGLTEITGGLIRTGTILSSHITTATLAAIVADLGAVTAGSIVVGTTNKIWLNEGADGVLAIGGATKASAPFRVTAAGALTATSATITGTITSTSGTIGGWTLGATSLTSGTGANTRGIDSGGTNPAFYAGSATPGSAPFRVSIAGAVTTSNITITGGSVDIGSVTLNSSGLSLTAGTGTEDKVKWSDGSEINSSGDFLFLSSQDAVQLVSGIYTLTWRGNSLLGVGSPLSDLGDSANEWGDIFATNIRLFGLAGSGNDYACIDTNGVIFRSDAAC